MSDGPQVQIMSAQIVNGDNVVAIIDRIPVGGGTQVVTVDGTPEERTHPTSTTYHVRLVSPDRMVPDQVRDTDSYEDAVDLSTRYAARVADAAGKLADLAEDLRV